jgi:hypothetical protein
LIILFISTKTLKAGLVARWTHSSGKESFSTEEAEGGSVGDWISASPLTFAYAWELLSGKISANSIIHFRPFMFYMDRIRCDPSRSNIGVATSFNRKSISGLIPYMTNQWINIIKNPAVWDRWVCAVKERQ